jgi:hypothetical protein
MASVRQFSSAVGCMGITNEPLELLGLYIEVLVHRQSIKVPVLYV